MKVQLATRVDTGLRQRLRVYVALTGRKVEDVVSAALDGYLPPTAEMVRDGGTPRRKRRRWPDVALTVAHHGASEADLTALHDAFALCTSAVYQAWRGGEDPAFLALLEAEVDAINVMFAAIKQAAGRSVPAPRPA